jgi:hypothetical protein
MGSFIKLNQSKEIGYIGKGNSWHAQLSHPMNKWIYRDKTIN